MIEDVMLVFDGNIRRINRLLVLYSDLAAGPGRKSTYQLEILRASVVLLHSTMEDYLRNLLKWKLPQAGEIRMNEITLAGITEKNRSKFQLGELLAFRGKSVSEIIDLSIDEHLAKTSFNNVRDLSKFLRDVGVELADSVKNDLFPKLEQMMMRRHHIVHQADRSDKIGSGLHRYKSLNSKQVLNWKSSVDRFVLEVNKLLI